jgi:hypothetical protein
MLLNTWTLLLGLIIPTYTKYYPCALYICTLSMLNLHGQYIDSMNIIQYNMTWILGMYINTWIISITHALYIYTWIMPRY